MTRRPSALTLVAGLLVLLGARAALATPGAALVLAGPVDAVVAAGDGVAALRDGEVVLLDGGGRVVGRCRGAAPLAGAPRAADRTALPAEEVLGEAGLSDEDVSPEAEELLDDEGLEPPPRRRPAPAAWGAPRAVGLAGTPEAVWIATVDGLWRLDARDGACQPAGLGGLEISLVAARGANVAALADATLWRSRDGGVTFDVGAVLASRANALELAPDGETALAADEEGVVQVDAGAARTARRVLDGRVDALARCGADVVALAGDGVHLLDADGGDRLAGPRPPVRALACGGERLVAVGVGVWTSDDGAAWRQEAAGLGSSFAGVAVAAGHAWVASESGLALLDTEEAPGVRAEPFAPARPALADRRPPSWAGLLPRVAIAFDGWTESTGVAGWRLWLRATVTLGRRWQRSATENVEDLR